MFIATCVLGVLLALMLLFSAYGKLTHNPQVIDTVVGVGFPRRFIWLLAACECAGAVGILVGLYWWPIGVAAAIGVVTYFVLAIVAHLRAKRFDLLGAGMLLALAIAVLVLRLLTR
ncbi:DoxX family protein [Mycobacterium sp.]|uniref:DoxX family protein n=1 Tax=Mycobacterium sp. TaxID=1785 RepID=UPI003D0BAC4D